MAAWHSVTTKLSWQVLRLGHRWVSTSAYLALPTLNLDLEKSWQSMEISFFNNISCTKWFNVRRWRTSIGLITSLHHILYPWASYPVHKISGRACAGNDGNVFPATVFKENRELAIPACITAWPLSVQKPTGRKTNWTCYLLFLHMDNMIHIMWVTSWRCGCLVTWLCFKHQVTRQPHLRDLTHVHTQHKHIYIYIYIHMYWHYIPSDILASRGASASAFNLMAPRLNVPVEWMLFGSLVPVCTNHVTIQQDGYPFHCLRPPSNGIP